MSRYFSSIECSIIHLFSIFGFFSQIIQYFSFI